MIMKVLIIHPHLTFLGGAELVVIKLSDHLLKKGVENSVLTLSLSKEIAESNPNLNFITPNTQYDCVSKSANIKNASRTISETKILASLIKKHGHKFDLINLHNFPSSWGYACSGVKKPVVWYCNEIPGIWHNVNPPIILKLVYSLGKLFDRKIVKSSISEICCADGINQARIMENYDKKAVIVPYGIDCGFFDPRAKNTEFPGAYDLKDKFIISQVGLITPQKNQRKSIEMLSELAKSMDDIMLVCAGRVIDQEYFLELKTLIKNKGLEDKVIFTGNISQKQIRALYLMSKVSVFPVMIQGGWLSPFEAICCEKPVIVSPTMGASVIIKENNLGLVSDDLVSSVIMIRDSFEFYQKKAEKARIWVRENLTWDRFTDEMIKVFITQTKKWRNA